jgi:ACR3 family arsenite transporter
VAGPSALIGASNFFKLAVAAAISLFGFQSGAAIATLVDVLIELPVMLSVVWVANRSKGRQEASPAVIKNTASERAQSWTSSSTTTRPAARRGMPWR